MTIEYLSEINSSYGSYKLLNKNLTEAAKAHEKMKGNEIAHLYDPLMEKYAINVLYMSTALRMIIKSGIYDNLIIRHFLVSIFFNLATRMLVKNIS